MLPSSPAMGALLLLLGLATSGRGSSVCAPNVCVKGGSNSEIVAFDKNSNNYLIPGTYVGNYDPVVSLNQTISATTTGVVIHPPSNPITFAATNYKSKVTPQTPGSSASSWNSFFLPEGWYALINPGQAIWGSVPDRSQLLDANLPIQQFAAALCHPICSSHGNCTITSSTDGYTASCVCQEGWTGEACDQCATGYAHWSCTRCLNNCTRCDDGLLGTGACLGTTSDATSCNCVHGTCGANGVCDCAAGWYTNLEHSPGQCNRCLQGFYVNSKGDCSVCPKGCVTCGVGPGFTEPTCYSCEPNLNLSTTIPATCGATTNCGTGNYFANQTSCEKCDPACTACYGPGSSDCLECAAGHALLGGSCVGLDQTTGICDSSLSSLPGTYVMNNAPNRLRCDACPSSCLECYIPGFNTAAAFEPRCHLCQEGYLYYSQNGTCVETCPSGSYRSSDPGLNGTCSNCDSACNTCTFTSTYCTSCSNGYAYRGQCVNTCPSFSIQNNGVCSLCHPDCATCTVAGSVTGCSSCPSSRPVLVNGQCIPFCPQGEYFSGATNGCAPCDSSCSSCTTLGSCTTCADGYILESGLCQYATSCQGFFATHLGICLSSLVDKPKNTNLAYLALLSLLVAVIILAAVWYIRRERAKTRAATRQFAAHLDEQAVGRRMDAFPTSFFDRVFGGGHMDPDHANDGGSEFARDARAKHRLRNLIIPSRGGGGGRDNKSPVDATVLPASYSTNTVDNIPLSPISARERTKGGLMADAQVFAVCTPRQVSPSSSRSASPDNDPAPGSPSSSAYPPTPPRRSASMSMEWSPGSSGSSGAPGSPHSPLRTLPEAELWPHANARERVDQGVPVIRNGGGHRHMSSSSSSGGSELHDVWPAMRPRQHSAF